MKNDISKELCYAMTHLGEPVIVSDRTKGKSYNWQHPTPEAFVNKDETYTPSLRVWINTKSNKGVFDGGQCDLYAVFSIRNNDISKFYEDDAYTNELINLMIISLFEDWTAWGQTGRKSIQNRVLKAWRNKTLNLTFSHDSVIELCEDGELMDHS